MDTTTLALAIVAIVCSVLFVIALVFALRIRYMLNQKAKRNSLASNDEQDADVELEKGLGVDTSSDLEKGLTQCECDSNKMTTINCPKCKQPTIECADCAQRITQCGCNRKQNENGDPNSAQIAPQEDESGSVAQSNPQENATKSKWYSADKEPSNDMMKGLELIMTPDTPSMSELKNLEEPPENGPDPISREVKEPSFWQSTRRSLRRMEAQESKEAKEDGPTYVNTCHRNEKCHRMEMIVEGIEEECPRGMQVVQVGWRRPTRSEKEFQRFLNLPVIGPDGTGKSSAFRDFKPVEIQNVFHSIRDSDQFLKQELGPCILNSVSPQQETEESNHEEYVGELEADRDQVSDHEIAGSQRVPQSEFGEASKANVAEIQRAKPEAYNQSQSRKAPVNMRRSQTVTGNIREEKAQRISHVPFQRSVTSNVAIRKRAQSGQNFENAKSSRQSARNSQIADYEQVDEEILPQMQEQQSGSGSHHRSASASENAVHQDAQEEDHVSSYEYEVNQAMQCPCDGQIQELKEHLETSMQKVGDLADSLLKYADVTRRQQQENMQDADTESQTVSPLNEQIEMFPNISVARKRSVSEEQFLQKCQMDEVITHEKVESLHYNQEDMSKDGTSEVVIPPKVISKPIRKHSGRVIIRESRLRRLEIRNKPSGSFNTEAFNHEESPALSKVSTNDMLLELDALERRISKRKARRKLRESAKQQ